MTTHGGPRRRTRGLTPPEGIGTTDQMMPRCANCGRCACGSENPEPHCCPHGNGCALLTTGEPLCARCDGSAPCPCRAASTPAAPEADVADVAGPMVTEAVIHRARQLLIFLDEDDAMTHLAMEVPRAHAFLAVKAALLLEAQ